MPCWTNTATCCSGQSLPPTPGVPGHVLDVLQAMALHVTPTVTLKISSDDDDNRIYECAAEALADYIVTGNTRHFPRPYKATRILTSRQLVELLLGKQP